MNGIILRERTDKELNAVIRLRKNENGNVRFTVQKKNDDNHRIYSLEKPLFAHIRLTNKCNMNCPYCYAEENDKKIDMKDDDIYKLIDICDRNGIFNITWTGGEPFMHPQIANIINATYKTGINQTVLTNGTLISKNVLDKIPKDNNIVFQVSLNEAWNEDADILNLHEVILKNTQLLSTLGFDVIMTILLDNISIIKVEKLIKKLIKFKIPAVRFGLPVPTGRLELKENEYITLKKMFPLLFDLKSKYCNRINITLQFDRIKYNYSGFPKRFLMCEAGTTQIYIDNNGDVYPCPLLKSCQEFYCGNVFFDKWEELWNSSPMNRLRNISECENCEYNCTVWCRALKYFSTGTLEGQSQYCHKKRG